MGLDELRARLDSLLAKQGLQPDRRARAAGLHDALVEFKTALAESRAAGSAAERELDSERRQLADAERRGGLAQGIGDGETARIAEEFTQRHRERIALLTRKLGVIVDETAYLEREYQALAAQYQAVRQGSGPAAAAPRAEDPEFDALTSRANREAAERAVQAQLELLKQKLKRGETP